MSIKPFPGYKHLLQENYAKYKHIYFFQNVTEEVFFLHLTCLKVVVINIPCSFLVINICNQGKTLCSPCIYTLCSPVYILYAHPVYIYIYRVSIKSFPDYKHLLQEDVFLQLTCLKVVVINMFVFHVVFL